MYTVESVVKEIRDLKTRESLNVTLYTLKFKEPSTEAIRFGRGFASMAFSFPLVVLVSNYAKKTGDYPFLSAVDLRLLALTYQLYEENVGTENLNLEPKLNVGGNGSCDVREIRFLLRRPFRARPPRLVMPASN